jgi:phosphoglycolate phosphatase
MARAVVMFDMDGTLADTMPQLTEFFVRVYREDLGFPEAEARELMARLMRLPSEQLPAAIAQAIGREMTEIPESTRQRMFAEFQSLPIVLFPEVESTLASLKSKGYSLVFSSNTPRPAVEARLEAAGIRAYFDIALGTFPPEGVFKREHPRIAREQLDMSEEQFVLAAVYVGDAEGDMALAKAAGIVAVGRLTGGNEEELRQAGADYVIRDLTELDTLLASLDSKR